MMTNTGRQKAEETSIQGLIEQYLVSRSALKSSIGETSLHLDEDSLAAFTEGSMSRREAVPVVSHLVDCGFCRHKTAELVKLDLELFAEDEVVSRSATTEPSAISRVLNDIVSRIFGSSEQAVFAHNEEEKSEPDSDKKD